MKKVLVLGASGYIGSQLLPLLLDKGYAVTAAARHIDYLESRTQPHPNLTLRYLDLADAETTKAVVSDFDLVFFLVHGMAQGDDFVEYELNLALNFKYALEQSSVEHVIYLSAIQPQTGNSRHLAARKATGKIIRQSGIPVTELRAGVIIGPGSAAFEIMRDFVYNLPILIAPKWVDSKANPIALPNLNHYLLKLAEAPSPEESQIYEVGGPDTLSYREQFKVICRITNKPYRLWSTPLLTPKMASYWLGLVTSVPTSIGKALLAGLEHDYIANSKAIEERFPQTLISYEQAVTDTIQDEGTFVRSNVWGLNPQRFVDGNQDMAITQNKLERALKLKPPLRHYGKWRKRSGVAKKVITLPTSCGVHVNGSISFLVAENRFAFLLLDQISKSVILLTLGK